MKILICGKGGSGKSTIAALLASSMARRGFRVLVIDADESNYGLHRQLGLNLPPDFLSNFREGERPKQRVKREPGPRFLNEPWGINDIPEEYLSGGNGIQLLAIGKIHQFGQGCACPMGSLSRELLENLALKDKEIAIVDTEAGIEHFGRAVERGCDMILVVLDPSYESVILSRKISEMASSIGKPVYLVLNKLDGTSREAMMGEIDRSLLAGSISIDPEIFSSGMRGYAISGINQDAEALAGFVNSHITGS